MTTQTFRLDVPLGPEHLHAPPGRLLPHAPASTLHGELVLPDVAFGIVVLVAASGSEALERHGDWHGRMLRAGLGTVEIDLLASDAARFADAALHLPLLTDHLLAVIHRIDRLIESEAVPPLPVGLFAAGHTTPVAIRAAAIRDSSVAALACAGGLVDLAGLLYLRELKAPLLMLLTADDTAAAANLSRARPHLGGPVSIETLPEDNAARAEAMAEKAARWFDERFAAIRPTARKA